MPDSVIRIGDSAFSNCENLKYVRYSNNVDYIPSSCFSGCRNLETFDYNGHLKLIRSGAFSYCMKLNTIFNLEHCSLIDDLAFNQCRNVNEFHIQKQQLLIVFLYHQQLKFIWSMNLNLMKNSLMLLGYA